MNVLEKKNYTTPVLSNRIYYEIISTCNLKCVHCSDLLKTSKTKYLSSAKLLEFNDKMLELGIDNIVVTGGEPTLHRDFYQLVEKLAVKSQVLVTTNGTNFDFDRVFSLLKSNPNIKLQISMDGIEKVNFEKVRGKNVYDRVIKLIEFLISKNLNNQIGLSMTILQSNKNDVKSIVSFAREYNLSFIHFPTLLPIGVARRRWEEIVVKPEEQLDIEEYLLSELADNTGTIVSSNRINQIISRISHKEKGDCLKNITLKVTPEGLIFPCPAASDPITKIGTIDENNINDLLIDRITERFTDYLGLFENKLDVCGNCDAHQYCLSRFCSNCEILSPPNKKFIEYECSILRQHYANALKEIG